MNIWNKLKEWWLNTQEEKKLYGKYMALHMLSEEDLAVMAHKILTERCCSEVPEDRLVLMAAAMRYVIIVNNKTA